MGKIIKVVFIAFFSFVIISCKSTYKKLENDYYQIINLVLEEGKGKSDSLYISMPYNKKEFNNRKNENQLHNIFKQIDIMSDDFFMQFNNFLIEETEVNFNNENAYFIKQISNYEVLDTNRIRVKGVKYLPRARNLNDTIKYLSEPYAKYGFGLSRPVFTKNGKYALIDYYGRRGDGGTYINIYIKENTIWRKYKVYKIGIR